VADIGKDRSEGSIRAHSYKDAVERLMSDLPDVSKSEFPLSGYYHRFHVVWVTKYRFKVLQGKMRQRLREIIRQTCAEMRVQIVKGVLSTDHVHMFLSIPAAPGAVDGDAADQGTFFAPHPDGVSRAAQEVLGQALLGAWVLLNHVRQRDRQYHTSVSRTALRSETYRPQPVVV
jgi:hypothetical protein